jgi:hypothetical protein
MTDGNKTDFFSIGRLHLEIMQDGYIELIEKSILTEVHENGSKYIILMR